MKAQQWKTIELELTDTKARHTVDCGISAVFTAPSGKQIRRDAFYEEGDLFKIRFAPTELGQWQYCVTGLAEGEAKGVVECVPYTGDVELYQHGFIRVAEHRQHLCYADGTPFLWLGDTHWQFATEEMWDKSNDPRFESQFRAVVDKRIEQQFNVYQCNFYIIRDGGPFEHAVIPFMETEEGFVANPDFFHHNLDKKMAYLAERGMTIAAGLTWHNQILREGGVEYFRMVAKYIIARYGAYPMVWTLAGEVGGYGAALRQRLIDDWRIIALDIQRLDDYQHLRTVHYTNERPFADYYQDEEWLDFTLNQSGHGDYPIDYRAISAFRKAYPNKPFVEGESMYENILTLEPNGRRRATDEIVRRVAYITMQSGGCGYTYGAQGLWFMQWDVQTDHRRSGLHFGSYDPWYVGLEFPGAEQMGLMHRFYREVGWSKLRPVEAHRYYANGGGDLVVSIKSEDMKLLYTPFVTADKESDVVVAYFASTNVYPMTIILPAGKKYHLRWFHPEDGTWSDIGDATIGKEPWKSPAKPDERDMLLVMTAVSE